MAEEVMKTRSFRISEEVSEKLKAICSEFPNQSVALESLISAYEVQNATAVLTDRQTDISDYNSHMQALQTAFLHSLEVNENAESRIRQEFQRQLESKDLTISDLHERIRKAESDAERATEQATIETAEADARVEQVTKENDSLQKEITSLKKQSSELSESLTAVKSQIADKQQIIDNLNQKLTDTKVMTSKVESAEARAVQAESELSDIKLELSEAKKLHESEVKELNQKYEAEVRELKQQLASQQTTAEQSAKLAERLAEADKREAIASLKESYVAELDELRRKIQTLTEEIFNLKSQKKSN